MVHIQNVNDEYLMIGLARTGFKFLDFENLELLANLNADVTSGTLASADSFRDQIVTCNNKIFAFDLIEVREKIKSFRQGRPE